MLKIKSKEKVMREYVSRYPELDNFARRELSREYDRYMYILRDCNTKEEYYKVFSKEIKRNEQRYRDTAHNRGLEGSPHNQFMEILACYGLIKFFRDNMLDEDK